MTMLLFPFLDGITEAERSGMPKQLRDTRKCPMSAESQRTTHWATLLLLMAAITGYLILTFEILGLQ